MALTGHKVLSLLVVITANPTLRLVGTSSLFILSTFVARSHFISGQSVAVATVEPGTISSAQSPAPLIARSLSFSPHDASRQADLQPQAIDRAGTRAGVPQRRQENHADGLQDRPGPGVITAVTHPAPEALQLHQPRERVRHKCHNIPRKPLPYPRRMCHTLNSTGCLVRYHRPLVGGPPVSVSRSGSSSPPWSDLHSPAPASPRRPPDEAQSSRPTCGPPTWHPDGDPAWSHWWDHRPGPAVGGIETPAGRHQRKTDSGRNPCCRP